MNFSPNCNIICDFRSLKEHLYLKISLGVAYLPCLLRNAYIELRKVSLQIKVLCFFSVRLEELDNPVHFPFYLGY